MMTPEQRQVLRRAIGEAVRAEQNSRRSLGWPPDVVLPEIISALLSLAAFIAANNAQLERADFMRGCNTAANEVYK